jgi:predicted SAM-dependent methyltransferase
MATRLNLGASTDIRAGWVNADIFAAPGIDVVTNLDEPWPWPESSVDEIYAADIFEHLQNRIFTMNQAWLVLKPGGILTMECPDAAKGAGQWQDCTHVMPWTPNGLQYFADGSPAHKRFSAAYGITARFKILGVTERVYKEFAGDPNGHGVYCDVWKFTALLEAVKNG